MPIITFGCITPTTRSGLVDRHRLADGIVLGKEVGGQLVAQHHTRRLRELSISSRKRRPPANDVAHSPKTGSTHARARDRLVPRATGTRFAYSRLMP